MVSWISDSSGDQIMMNAWNSQTLLVIAFPLYQYQEIAVAINLTHRDLGSPVVCVCSPLY